MSNFFYEHRQEAGDISSIFLKAKAFNKPHRGLRRGALIVRRGSKPAENAARRKKDHFRMEIN
jgi:hypothetical protein